MLIFNTTFLVSDKKYGVWYKWLYEHHIPAMLGSGYFFQPQLAKVLTADPQDGTSYSLQFHVNSMKELALWEEQNMENFLQDFSECFSEDVLLFTTILEIME